MHDIRTVQSGKVTSEHVHTKFDVPVHEIHSGSKKRPELRTSKLPGSGLREPSPLNYYFYIYLRVQSVVQEYFYFFNIFIFAISILKYHHSQGFI